MPRRPVNAEPCPVARAVDRIGDRWSLLILRDAFDGTRRFGDFQRNLGRPAARIVAGIAAIPAGRARPFRASPRRPAPTHSLARVDSLLADGQLVQRLPDCTPAFADFYADQPSRRQRRAPLHGLLDHLASAGCLGDASMRDHYLPRRRWSS